jgi:uncharacterized membrane protein (DUF4010 family)
MSDLSPLSEHLGIGLKFLTSLGIGLLLGLQRERTPSAKAGLRTFALVALLGTIAGLIADATADAWIVATGLALVGLMIVAAYHQNEHQNEHLTEHQTERQTEHRAEEPDADSGTTTVVAVLLCYALGVMVWYDHSRLAAAIGIVATILLQFKTQLHGFSERLSQRDLASVLQFAVLSFIILPLLPDEGFDQYRVLNPYHVWLMVVLVSGISLSGYLALRLIGARESLPLVGILGGLVSSTATTVVYARQGRGNSVTLHVAGSIIATANLVPLARLSVMGAVVSPAVLPALLPVLATGLALGVIPLVQCLRSALAAPDLEVPELETPTNLRVAVGFGAIYALVLFGSAWLSEHAGSHGLYAIAFASGFVDVDAITLSSFKLLDGGMVTASVAATAIGIAYVAAVLFKLAVLALLGGRELLRYCAPSLLASAVGVAVGLVLFA